MNDEQRLHENITDSIYNITKLRALEIQEKGTAFQYATNDTRTFKALQIGNSSQYYFEKGANLPQGTELKSLSNNTFFVVLSYTDFAGRDYVELLAVPYTADFYSKTQIPGKHPTTGQPMYQIKQTRSNVRYNSDGSGFRFFYTNCPPTGSILKANGNYFEITGISRNGNVASFNTKPFIPQK